MKLIEIHHTTDYAFGAPVVLGAHWLRLRPREGHDLRIASSVLDTDPAAALTWRRDLYDNVVAVAEFGGAPCLRLHIESRLRVELYDAAPLAFVVEEHALHFPFEYQQEERIALAPYLAPLYPDHERLERWLDAYRKVSPGTETFGVLDAMNHRIHEAFGYEVRAEEGVLTPAALLDRGKGSCRDLAALFLEACRRLGIAARFVSGYVHGPATEAGGASTHAWAEVYLPGAGWKGFDPTNLAVVGPDHIPVAVHRQPEALPPVAGTFAGPEGVASTLSVAVKISAVPG